MKIKKLLLALIVISALAVPSMSFAEGFGVYEWSAAGVAMGDNYMFADEDPAVLAYNPAAITRLNGTYLSIGATWVNPANNTTFSGMSPLGLNAGKGVEWTNSYSPAIVPSIYYATKAGKNSWWGLAIYARYGNQIEYDKQWPGRYDTTFSGIQGVTFQPTYAWKMTPKLSAAVGLDINYMNLVMEKAINPSFINYSIPLNPNNDIQTKIDGTSVRLGGIVSFMYDFTKDTSAALVYRTKIKHTMDADATFSTNPYVKDTMAHGSVTLPDSVTFGLGHKFNGGKTRVEFNTTWTNWSTYDRLKMNFDNGLLSDSEKDWAASWRLGLGIEHRLSDKWSLLGGYVWEESPVPDKAMDFTVPTGDRNRVSIGFKYRPNDRSEWAFAYTSIWAGDRTVNSHIGGADYVSGRIHDSRTQLVSLGYTIKLK